MPEDLCNKCGAFDWHRIPDSLARSCAICQAEPQAEGEDLCQDCDAAWQESDVDFLSTFGVVRWVADRARRLARTGQ